MERQRTTGRLVGAALLAGTLLVTSPGLGGATPSQPSGQADISAAPACPPAPFGVQVSAPGGGRTVALTFDGGPGVSTEAIMRILEDNGVAATFFNIGDYLADRPTTVVSQAAQGFQLGNHTWSHPHMTTLTAAGQADEMDRYNAEQTRVVGFPACVFRPPFGEYNSTTLSVAQARNMGVFNWSVDTLDWQVEGRSDATAVNGIIARAQAGGSQTHPVLLMHNGPVGNPATVAALPSIITFYRDRGYTFVDLTGRVLDRPIAGDWDGDGTVTPGVVRGNTWYLRNSTTTGPADIVFSYGGASDRVITGDWDGNGTWTPGVVRGNRWYLRNSNSAGPGMASFGYGSSSDRVLTGDWDGNGTFTPGVVRGNRWYLRNANSTGPGTIAFNYGGLTDRILTGDWDGTGTFTPGVVRGTRWYLRNENSTGAGTVALTFGP
jgi:peptidoglycan/xylan/chitin deacetylase (PgdA/CDA1 family)